MIPLSEKKFRFKSETVFASQWFKNGDHPNDETEYFPATSHHREFEGEGKVVRYFRSPDMPGRIICALCGSTMHDHGWIDGARNGGISHVVCPGDWVITDKEGFYAPYRPDIFARIFEEVR